MNWGQQNLERLIYREQLLYWRERQASGFKAMALEAAQKAWDIVLRDDFIQGINAGIFPDIVSDFFEIVPVVNIELRTGAIEHDISYALGGSEQARRNADDRLYWWIVNECKAHGCESVLASQIWIAIRACGRKHFFYTDGEGT